MTFILLRRVDIVNLDRISVEQAALFVSFSKVILLS